MTVADVAFVGWQKPSETITGHLEEQGKARRFPVLVPAVRVCAGVQPGQSDRD